MHNYSNTKVWDTESELSELSMQAQGPFTVQNRGPIDAGKRRPLYHATVVSSQGFHKPSPAKVPGDRPLHGGHGAHRNKRGQAGISHRHLMRGEI